MLHYFKYLLRRFIVWVLRVLLQNLDAEGDNPPQQPHAQETCRPENPPQQPHAQETCRPALAPADFPFKNLPDPSLGFWGTMAAEEIEWANENTEIGLHRSMHDPREFVDLNLARLQIWNERPMAPRQAEELREHPMARVTGTSQDHTLREHPMARVTGTSQDHSQPEILARSTQGAMGLPELPISFQGTMELDSGLESPENPSEMNDHADLPEVADAPNTEAAAAEEAEAFPPAILPRDPLQPPHLIGPPPPPWDIPAVSPSLRRRIPYTSFPNYSPD